MEIILSLIYIKVFVVIVQLHLKRLLDLSLHLVYQLHPKKHGNMDINLTAQKIKITSILIYWENITLDISVISGGEVKFNLDSSLLHNLQCFQRVQPFLPIGQVKA